MIIPALKLWEGGETQTVILVVVTRKCIQVEQHVACFESTQVAQFGWWPNESNAECKQELNALNSTQPPNNWSKCHCCCFLCYSTHAYLVFAMFWISIRITTEDKHAAVQCSYGSRFGLNIYVHWLAAVINKGLKVIGVIVCGWLDNLLVRYWTLRVGAFTLQCRENQ